MISDDFRAVQNELRGVGLVIHRVLLALARRKNHSSRPYLRENSTQWAVELAAISQQGRFARVTWLRQRDA